MDDGQPFHLPAADALDRSGPASSPPPLLTWPLADVASWTACLRDREIPILADTAEAIEAMRANEDAVDANSLGELVAADPLMTLKLLVHASRNRPARVVTDPETVIGALVMMGISPFFRAFGRQPDVERRLSPNAEPAAVPPLAEADDPSALGGLRQAISRCRRAGNFAWAFAVHRADHHAAAIYQAALLHDFAELLLWCHAPLLAQRIRELQRVDPTLRSATVQHVVLNAELPNVQAALVLAWQLPELLTRVTDGRHADHPSVRSVLLAVRLARRDVTDWNDPALADDVRDVGKLLTLPPEATIALLGDADR